MVRRDVAVRCLAGAAERCWDHHAAGAHVIAGVIAAAMVGGSMLAARQLPYAEKVRAYECGFDAFDDARRQFDVRYYLVAILFIIFDLEVAFLFPWAVTLGHIGLFGFFSMLAFLGVLTVGFIYEWCKGALEWE